MRAYARKFGADEEKFGVTGLLHDFDYEKFPTPQEHPFVGNKIMRGKGSLISVPASSAGCAARPGRAAWPLLQI